MSGCKVCGDPATVRSHLIPRAFIHRIRGNDPHVIVGNRFHDGYSHTQAGFFADDILCDIHEHVLHPFDDYAIRFSREATATNIPPHGRWFKIKNVSSDLLVRFAAAVLWRCHHARHYSAKGVDVGPFEPTLKSLLFDGGSTDWPPTYLYIYRSRTVDTDEFASLPASKRVDRTMRWSFQVGSLNFLVDLGQLKSSLHTHRMNGCSEIYAYSMDFDKAFVANGWAEMSTRMAQPRARR